MFATRAVRLDEGPRLKEVAIAAKSRWGYDRMGARYIRDRKPSAWGRIIPVMGLDL